MKNFNNKISNLLDQISQVDNMILLHKDYNDEMMLHQYQARRMDYMKELVSELIHLNASTPRIHEIIKSIITKIERLPEKLKEQIFEKLFEVAEIAKFSQAQLIQYEDSLKEYRDMFSVMSTQRNKGRKEGIKEGENKKAFAIAKKLLKKNVPVKDISEITELSISEIKKIKK